MPPGGTDVGRSLCATMNAVPHVLAGGALPSSYVSNGNWDNVARIQNVASALLIFHGLADDFVRPEFSKQIYAAAKDPKKLVLVEGADHGNVPEKLGGAYGDTVHAWVNEHLPQEP